MDGVGFMIGRPLLQRLTGYRDEILYHAKIHPEQYSNTLSDEQIKELNSSMRYVCDTSVELLADSERFPEHWLFKHRWGKGKKDQPSVLPNGKEIVFLTVGGRTSAVVPSVQKKTGAVSKDVSDEDVNGAQTQSKRKRGAVKKEENDFESKDDESKGQSKRQSKASVKDENEEDTKQTTETASAGRRRSTRNKK